MKDREARQEARVRKCVAEIQAQITQLEDEHTPFIVTAGLAEYLGDTLNLAQKLNACSRAQARVICERVREIASTEKKSTPPMNGQL